LAKGIRLNATEAVRTKLEVREFSSKAVPSEVKKAILEAARLSPSGSNTQHWRFILVEKHDSLKRLADDSSTGKWVAGAGFAVIVCTDPAKGYHLIDAGRVVQDMEITAWDYGVASRVFTGIKEAETRRDFAIPGDLDPTIVVGFGYPAKELQGRKNRRPLSELAYLEKFGNPIGSAYG
jgi:nitroreductase